MTPASPPFPKSVNYRLVAEGVSAQVMVERFGSPRLRDEDPAAVLAPTDYWAFRLSGGEIVILGHMPDYDKLIVEADTKDLDLLVRELELAGFKWTPFEVLR